MLAIREFIKPPIFNNQDVSRQAKQLNAILLSVGALVLAFVIIRIALGGRVLGTTNLVLELLVLVMIGLRYALQQGYVQSASYALVATAWVAFAYLAWDADGIRDVAFIANIIVILVSSMLLGWRVATGFTILTIALGWFLAYAENSGILDTSLDTPGDTARDLTVIFIITAVLIYLVINSLQQALDRARQSEKELLQLNSELEQRVQKRTQELSQAQEHSEALLTELAEALRVAHMANYELILLPEQMMIFSEHFFELLGTTADAEGGHWLPVKDVVERFVYSEDRVRLLEDIRSAGTDQLEGELEYRLLHRTDGVRHFIFRFIVETNEAGQASSVRGIVQDITERKQAEEALRRTEDIYRRAIASADAVPYSRRYGDETFTFMGNRIYEMTGYTAEEITPPIFDEILDETIVHTTPLPHAEAVQQARSGNASNWRADYRLRTRDGRSRWISDNSIELVGADGQSTGSVGIMLDITERKEAETALARQAAELETVTELATAVATISDPTLMLQTVVDMTQANFNLYHAHIYLLNAGKDTLQLAAGSGEAGRVMTAQKHAIPLKREQSLVARAARSRQLIAANDVRQNPLFMPNPLLPDTRAELAVPIIVGDEVLGVLDVQSQQVDYFTAEESRIQTILAAQIGVALQNARANEQTAQTLQELDAFTRRLTREGWQNYFDQRQGEQLGFVLMGDEIKQIGEARSQGMGEGRSITKPVLIGGEPIGQMAAAEADMDEVEVEAILTAVSQGLSAHLENLRLNEQTERALAEAQRRTEELVLINQLVSAVSATIDIQESMQIMIDEVIKATSADQARVLLLSEDGVHLVVAAERSISQNILGLRIPVADDPLAAKVLESRHTQIVNDPQHDPLLAPVHHIMRAQGVEQLVIIPLAVGNRPLGTLALEVLTQGRRIKADELRLAETLVFQVATAIQNARLFEQVQSRARQEQILREVTARVYAAPDAESVLKTAAQEVSRILGVEALVYLEDPQGSITKRRPNGHN